MSQWRKCKCGSDDLSYVMFNVTHRIVCNSCGRIGAPANKTHDSVQRWNMGDAAMPREPVNIPVSETFTYIGTTGWKMWQNGDDDEAYYFRNLTDYDLNEDHNCGACEADLPGRFLFCNKKCHDEIFPEEGQSE